MPWRERSPMDERVQFISDYQRQLFTITELCDRFGVSRKTGYKWIARYAADGAAGLTSRSSRPGHSPQATDDGVVAAIEALRRRHPTWGGKKILAVLTEREPTWSLPAVSTANDILKRAGLVIARRRRRTVGHPGYQASPVTEPNAVWTADFKGQFRTTAGPRPARPAAAVSGIPAAVQQRAPARSARAAPAGATLSGVGPPAAAAPRPVDLPWAL